MQEKIKNLLCNLELFGKENDQTHSERGRKMLNITPDTGEFLAVLVKAMTARQILEIGTSNGYSTIWLAEAARANDGTVTTIEKSDYKIGLAKENFQHSGLLSHISLAQDEADKVLTSLADGSFDLIFLDSERSEYVGWFPDIKRVLRPRGLLVVDNAVSHKEEMEPFMTLVDRDSDFTTSLVPVGNGEFLAVKISR